MRLLTSSRFLLVLTLFVLSALNASTVYAQGGNADLSISPAIIDEKAKARDIIKESVTITNTSNHKLLLYPSVFNVRPGSGQEGFHPAVTASDRSDSLANWIELSRGVIELNPGEERQVPFTIRVNLNAVPDAYHAVVSFSDGGTRESAEASGALAATTINVEVQADIKEDIQLKKFSTDNLVFSGDDVLFKYQLENIGNQGLSPKGEIRIYNRRGEEVASIDVNQEGKVISPAQVGQLATVWNAVSGFGQYKAVLSIKYGTVHPETIEDTVFFWILPWQELLGLFIASLITIVVLALYFNRWFERRHLGKLVDAGIVKQEVVTHMDRIQEPLLPTVTAREALQMAKAPLGKMSDAYAHLKREGFVNVPKPLVPDMRTSVTTSPVAASLRDKLLVPGVGRSALAPTTIMPVEPVGDHTIDLSRLSNSSHAQTVPQEGNIINLKRGPTNS